MKRTKLYYNRVLSLFLAILMVISILPASPFIVSAANTYKYDSDEAIAYAKKHWNDGKGLCAEFVSDCLKAGGFSEPYHVNAKQLGKNLQKYGKKVECKGWKSNKNFTESMFDGTISKGDVIVWVNYDGCKVASGHVMLYSGSTNSKGEILVYAHNSAKNKATTAPSSYAVEAYAVHLDGKPAHKITTLKVSSKTNKTATISVGLDDTATVSKWTYFLSKDSKALDKIDGTKGSTHQSTSTVDCVRILDYQKNPKKEKTDSFTIDKFKNKPLEANTPYYLKMTVYIGESWYEADSILTVKTDNKAPGTPTVTVAKASKTVGVGDPVTVLWNQTTNTDNYTITVKDSSNAVVQTKSKINGLTCSLDGIKKAGTYTVAIASNGYGSTTGKSDTFTVMPNVNVSFYDPIGDPNLTKPVYVDSVPYGHSATPPKNPQAEGHTFSKWDTDFSKCTTDLKVKAVYDLNTYTVKFVDSNTNKTVKTQTVKYNDSATAPTIDSKDIPEGFELSGWDKDFEHVKSDMTIYTVYEWADSDNTATATINSVERNTTKAGYDVKVTVKNQIDKISTGRVVAVLKSEKGVILTTTESSAFAIDNKGSKTISFTILYPTLAPKIEVYVINAYESLGQISKVAKADIDNNKKDESGWYPNMPYKETTTPMTSAEMTAAANTIKSQNGYSDVEIVLAKTEVTPTKNYYRYKIKETTTSYSTSLSGWTQDGYNKVKSGSQVTVNYVSSWPSGFKTDNALYKKYNNKPVSASNTSTQIVEIDSTNSAYTYIYWHWCRGDSVGSINRSINWSKTSTFDTFHAFEDSTKKKYNSSANAYEWKKTDKCSDTYWWNGAKTKVDGLVTVKQQKYTVYNKQYKYYKVSDYSNWIEYTGSIPVANGGSAGTNKTYQNVETNTVQGSTKYTYQYRYKTSSSTPQQIVEPEVDSNRIYTLSGKVDNIYAGKDATVWVYKYTQASDYTTEYVGETKVLTDGTISISSAVLREAPTQYTGDYTIVVSIAGQDRAFVIGTIEAEKPTYTVNFYDFDETTIISTQKVKEGGTAEIPSKDKLTVPEGCRFTNWSESVVNVKGNMNVTPECELEQYRVVFVNWEMQEVSLKTFEYDTELIADEIPTSRDGYVAEWVVQVGDEYMTIEEFTESGRKVKGDMVVVTRSEPEKYAVTLCEPDKKKPIDSEETLTDDEIQKLPSKKQSVENGNHINFSEVQMTVEESPEYIFLGWINAETGEAMQEDTVVTENVTLYPSYIFSNTAEMPEANVVSGEYTSNQMVTLTSGTTDATIWYTTDGSDPTTSSTAIEYTTPITISKSCILRCYAGAMMHNDSEENTLVYAINTSGNPKYHLVTIWSNLLDLTGDDAKPGLVREGSKLPSALIESNSEYDFTGIYYDQEHTEEFDYNSEVVLSSLDLFAYYTPKIFEVKFIIDGNIVEKQYVSCFEDATEPNVPSKVGYKFVGWDTDLTCITDDLEISAIYISEDDYATVKLNRSRPLNLAKGTSFKNLVATITPDNHSDYEIEWYSSDEFVATVDQYGNITAINEGTADIYARLPLTNSVAKITVNVSVDSERTIVIKSSSKMGFDDNHNLREVPIGSNTVAELRTQFENEDLVFTDYSGNELGENDLVGTGSKISLYDGEELLDSTTVILTGDFNRDGYVNAKDASMIGQYVLDRRTADDIQWIAIDVNGDGRVNNRDRVMLLRYLVGKETL